MLTNELLLELFSEEIPARMQVKAASSMLETLEKEIKVLGLSYKKAQFFVTPRRIALYIDGLPTDLPEKIIDRKGPKIDARAEAIDGFLKSIGMKLEELSIVDGFYYAKKIEAAKPADLSLKMIITQILKSFTWPKSMRVGMDRSRWVRPLRNIMCLFAGKILELEFAGLKANNYSFGHRFMAPNQLEISSFTDYSQKMRQAFVVLSSDERREIITKEALKAAQALGLKLILDQDLLNEVTGLVEYPNILLGEIEARFVNLPKEVLVSSMKTHQRYFYLEDEGSNISPYFIFAANVKHKSDTVIIEGNEKVLRARLADAEFFWQQDLKQPTSENLAKLSKMTFHSKLGSMFDKTNRIIALAEFIANKLGFSNLDLVKKAALLAKTDLVSEMVGEFPELQGIMGKYYAEKSGEEPEVCLAIAEHYRPIDTNDLGDISYLGAIIAIADKLDTIIGLWLADEKPTSSKDPFALRRAALGIIKLILHHKLNLSLLELVADTASNYQLDSKEQQQEIVTFFADRLKYYLKAENFRHDLIMATLSEGVDDIHAVIVKLTELQQFMKHIHAQKLVFAMKRILKILTDNKLELSLNVNQELFKPIELKLYNQAIKIKATFEDLVFLVPAIDQFFDEVLVNDADIQLKQNRLNLLNNIACLSKKVTNFSLIEV